MSIQFCVNEQEARAKWCPFGRAADQADGDHRIAINRAELGKADAWCKCLGSDCMAWRWVSTHVPDGKGDMNPSSDTHGYCGLAGPAWSRS